MTNSIVDNAIEVSIVSKRIQTYHDRSDLGVAGHEGVVHLL
jgi:hypothetical protein